MLAPRVLLMEILEVLFVCDCLMPLIVILVPVSIGTFVLNVVVMLLVSHGFLELCAISFCVNLGKMISLGALVPPSASCSDVVVMAILSIAT